MLLSRGPGKYYSLAMREHLRHNLLGLRRQVRQLTQNQLAQLSGVSQPTISRIEKGHGKEVGSATLSRLAAALQTTTDNLLSGATVWVQGVRGSAREDPSTKEVLALISLFSELSPPNRNRALELLRHYVAEQERMKAGSSAGPDGTSMVKEGRQDGQ